MQRRLAFILVLLDDDHDDEKAVLKKRTASFLSKTAVTHLTAEEISKAFGNAWEQSWSSQGTWRTRNDDNQNTFPSLPSVPRRAVTYSFCRHYCIACTHSLTHSFVLKKCWRSMKQTKAKKGGVKNCHSFPDERKVGNWSSWYVVVVVSKQSCEHVHSVLENGDEERWTEMVAFVVSDVSSSTELQYFSWRTCVSSLEQSEVPVLQAEYTGEEYCTAVYGSDNHVNKRSVSPSAAVLRLLLSSPTAFFFSSCCCHLFLMIEEERTRRIFSLSLYSSCILLPYVKTNLNKLCLLLKEHHSIVEQKKNTQVLQENDVKSPSVVESSGNQRTRLQPILAVAVVLHFLLEGYIL